MRTFFLNSLFGHENPFCLDLIHVRKEEYTYKEKKILLYKVSKYGKIILQRRFLESTILNELPTRLPRQSKMGANIISFNTLSSGRRSYECFCTGGIYSISEISSRNDSPKQYLLI